MRFTGRLPAGASLECQLSGSGVRDSNLPDARYVNAYEGVEAAFPILAGGR